MFFLKQTTTLLLIIAFTQAFSQEWNSEERRLNDEKSIDYSKSNMNNQINHDGEESVYIHKEVNMNDLLVMVFDNPNQENDNVEAEPIQFLGPSSGAEYKKGKMIQVRWTGGNPDEEYALDLFDGRFHYRHIGELKNSGTYPWVIPKDIEPGKEYKFKLTNTDDFGDFAFSESFVVKRKVPIAAWLIPGALVVGGAVYLIATSGTDELSDLPPPIDPN